MQPFQSSTLIPDYSPSANSSDGRQVQRVYDLEFSSQIHALGTHPRRGAVEDLIVALLRILIAGGCRSAITSSHAPACARVQQRTVVRKFTFTHTQHTRTHACAGGRLFHFSRVLCESRPAVSLKGARSGSPSPRHIRDPAPFSPPPPLRKSQVASAQPPLSPRTHARTHARSQGTPPHTPASRTAQAYKTLRTPWVAALTGCCRFNKN